MIDLRLGDCLQILPEIPNDSVDLVCVDIPFNQGVAYKTELNWDKKEYDSYIGWCGAGFMQAQRILKDSGSFYFFHNNFEVICDLQLWIRENTRFHFRQLIVWNKRFNESKKKGYLDGYVSTNNNRNYHKMAEYILFYTFDNHDKVRAERVRMGLKQTEISKQLLSKSGGTTGWLSNIESGKYFPNEQTIKPITKYLGLGLSDLVHTFNNQKTHHSVWNYDIDEKSAHPTQKPLALMENIIIHSSNEADMVVDYCMGSGTTGVAAVMHRRSFLGIELIQNYFDDAKVRINNALSEMGQADKILSPTASIPRLFA